MAVADTLDKPFSVLCWCRESTHRWEWCEVRAMPDGLTTLRKWARSQMDTLCPAVGDVLAWEPFRPDEPWDGINWTLRHGRMYLEPGEIAVAIALP